MKMRRFRNLFGKREGDIADAESITLRRREIIQ
jgi:hypothetical protein